MRVWPSKSGSREGASTRLWALHAGARQQAVAREAGIAQREIATVCESDVH